MVDREKKYPLMIALFLLLEKKKKDLEYLFQVLGPVYIEVGDPK